MVVFADEGRLCTSKVLFAGLLSHTSDLDSYARLGDVFRSLVIYLVGVCAHMLRVSVHGGGIFVAGMNCDDRTDNPPVRVLVMVSSQRTGQKGNTLALFPGPRERRSSTDDRVCHWHDLARKMVVVLGLEAFCHRFSWKTYVTNGEAQLHFLCSDPPAVFHPAQHI